jgi:hypothetical protein
MHVVNNMTYEERDRWHFWGFPCTRTVKQICGDSFTRGRVVGKRGRTGLQHFPRKFDDLAWELLVERVQTDQQYLLKDIAAIMSRRLGKS